MQRVRLTKECQSSLFRAILAKYPSKDLCNLIKISRSMIYHYKNYRVNNLSMHLLKHILELLKWEFDTLDILEVYTHEERVKEIRVKGRDKRQEQCNFMSTIEPPLRPVLKNGYANVELWLTYREQALRSFRNDLSIETTKTKIILRHSNYTRNGKRLCEPKLPRKIKIDDDFLYFFGLWLGDNAGWPRFGIVYLFSFGAYAALRRSDVVPTSNAFRDRSLLLVGFPK